MVKFIILECDFCKEKQIEVNAKSIDNARSQAKKRGWITCIRRKILRDMCDKCLGEGRYYDG